MSRPKKVRHFDISGIRSNSIFIQHGKDCASNRQLIARDGRIASHIRWPRNWKQLVNRSLPEAEIERLDASVARGRAVWEREVDRRDRGQAWSGKYGARSLAAA